MLARSFGLALVTALLGACTLDLGETATVDAELLRFQEMALDSETAEALSLAATPDETSDEVAAAGADFFQALFAPTASATSGAPAETGHTFGDPVPYGAIETVCGARRGQLGQKVVEAGGFTIYDSAPGSTALRAHYVTGFDDRCPRQFSAALVLTGSAEMHESVRYLSGNRLAYNGTDSAYEAIKASYCRVRHGKPCGSRMGALSRTTTFVTAYESFGSRPRWVEILLHDGEMSAIDFKAR
ncbi:MAG: hypothetical protein AAFQ64_16525 [Pseudomonadota bacterium]